MAKQPIRRPASMVQEEDSRDQFKPAVKPWLVTPVTPDHGEDVLVRVYENDGVSSGLSFYVQLKSVTEFKPTLSGHISYGLEVGHLIAWEHTNPPVVLVVWNVTDATGRWQPIPEIIKDLDARTPEWREKRHGLKVSARVPNKHQFDDGGKFALRYYIADNSPEVLRQPKIKEFKAEVDIPDGPEGREVVEHFQRTGELKLDAKFMRVEFTELFRRFFGEMPVFNAVVPFETPPPASYYVEATWEDRTAPMPIQATVLKVDDENWTRSTDEEDHVDLELVISRARRAVESVRLTFRSIALPAKARRQHLEFMDAFIRAGKATLKSESEGLVATLCSPEGADVVLPMVPTARTVIEQIAEIESVIGKPDQVLIPHRATGDDVAQIAMWHALLVHGRWENTESIVFEHDNAGAWPSLDAEPDQTSVFLDEEAELFNITHRVGTVIRTAKDGERLRDVVNARLAAVERTGEEAPAVTVEVTWLHRLATPADAELVARCVARQTAVAAVENPKASPLEDD